MNYEFFGDSLTDRQLKVVMHYMKILDTVPEKMRYVKAQEFAYELFPIDICIFEPVKDYFDYYLIGTVGLSSYKFDKNFARSELMMVLPSTWKFEGKDMDYLWPIYMLQDIAYGCVNNESGPAVGSVCLLKGEGKSETYADSSDAVGGIITLPEMFPIDMYSEKIENTFTTFFQVVPINKDDVQKLDEIGPLEFIKYELHDSEGPLMVADFKEPKPKGIEKIIRHNENMLKSNDD